MRLSSQHEPVALEHARVKDIEHLAYTLIETARIRCEQLRGCGAYGLEEIHRDLGLAGYHCSSEMPAEARQACLSLAREESGSLSSTTDRFGTLQTLFEEAIAASDALTHVLSNADADHLHVAHVYVMSATESLDHHLTVLAI